MEIHKNDILVVQYQEKKKFLVEVLKKSGKVYTGVIADESRASEDTIISIEFTENMVLGNFGKKPLPGSAFGVKLQPWRSMSEVHPWGVLHYFREISEKENKILLGALRKVGRQIQDLKLDASLPVDIHVRPPHTQYAGMFQYMGNKRHKRDIITYHPQNFSREDSEYIVWHEDGHRIWARMMGPELWAKWIKLYHQSVQLGLYDRKSIENMREQFVGEGLTAREFVALLETDEEVELFSDIVTWITGWNSISKAHFDILSLGDPEHLGKLWPSRQIEQFDQEMVISEYAKKNADEFFSEAWSFYFTSRPLPDRIKKAVERTLKAIRR